MVDTLARHTVFPAAVVFLLLTLNTTAPLLAGERSKVMIRSTIDDTLQPSYVILPDDFDPNGQPVPMLVALHSWSRDLEYRGWQLEGLANERGWIYLFPNFRGPNKHPDACGSAKAQQDILDVVTWAKKNYPVDEDRVYLAGASGGGHMSMLMAGRHPDVWAAASAWVGISDLVAWHKLHAGDKYGKMMRQSCGGPPGTSLAVDRQYRERSPMSYIHRAANVPLDLNTGIDDGHTGSVPIRHTLDAFNAIVRTGGHEPISEEEIQQLSRKDGKLAQPRDSDLVEDPSYGRAIVLRRHAGPVRVTVFDGGHEFLPGAAVAWLEKKVRSTEDEGRGNDE